LKPVWPEQEITCSSEMFLASSPVEHSRTPDRRIEALRDHDLRAIPTHARS
jgi:hypothetical protein